MKRTPIALLSLTFALLAGCGSGGLGGGGDVPGAGMERCENCGKDVAKGELSLKKDSKVCAECADKI